MRPQKSPNTPVSLKGLKRHRFDPGLERSPGVGNDNPLQYSCLENPMDRGTWWATVYGVTNNQTRLNRLRGSGAGTLGVPLEGTRRVGGLLGVAGRLSGPRTVAHQVPLSMGLPRQEYWSRLLCPSPGDLPNPGCLHVHSYPQFYIFIVLFIISISEGRERQNKLG